MKKFLLSILTIAYLTVSSGVVMEIHYCMGKRAGTDLYRTASDRCSHCGMKEKKGGCCNDEHKFYKLENAHKNVSNDYSASIPAVAMINRHVAYPGDLFPTTATGIFQNEASPGSSGPPIFIRNCVFRI